MHSKSLQSVGLVFFARGSAERDKITNDYKEKITKSTAKHYKEWDWEVEAGGRKTMLET